MYNENGKFFVLTKSISGTDSQIVQATTTALALVMLGIPILGSSALTTISTLGFINVYLPLPISIGFNNVQFKFYTTDPGVHWGITGFAYNGIMKDAVPPGLVQAS